MAQKKIWNTHFFAYMRDLDKTKPVVWTGDLNVAPTELGLCLVLDRTNVSFLTLAQICRTLSKIGTRLQGTRR